MSDATVVLITLVAYKALLISVGLWVRSRNTTTTDYLLGGRALGPLVAGLSYAASTSSAWVLLGFSGFVYTVGVGAVWMVPGIWAGYVVVWLVFGERLRRESLEHNQVTLTDFLLQDASGRARTFAAVVAALLIVLCFVFYIAAQFSAAGTAIGQHFGLAEAPAILVGAAIVLIYAWLGGFWAVSITDTIQAFTMLAVAIGVPLAGVVALGGFGGMQSALAGSMDPTYLSITAGHAGLVFAGFVLGTIGMSLGALGQPHLLSRLMAVKDERARRQGFAIAISWSVVVFVGMTVLGLAGRALMNDLPNGETVFYTVAANYLPAVLAGVVVAATLSAVMSTVDSILLAASGAVSHDLGVARVWPDRQVLVARLVMAGIALLAVVLTLSLPDSIFNRVLFAWSALGAAFGPIVVWRVLGWRVSAPTALFCMLSGFGVTVLFYTLGAGPAHDAWWSVAAHLPGDPFERVVPWLLPVAALAISRNS